MPRESAASDVAESEEYVDVGRSSTPVHCGVVSERLISGESLSQAFLQDLGGVFDTSGLPFCKFVLSQFIFSLLFFLV